MSELGAGVAMGESAADPGAHWHQSDWRLRNALWKVSSWHHSSGVQANSRLRSDSIWLIKISIFHPFAVHSMNRGLRPQLSQH